MIIPLSAEQIEKGPRENYFQPQAPKRFQHTYICHLIGVLYLLMSEYQLNSLDCASERTRTVDAAGSEPERCRMMKTHFCSPSISTPSSVSEHLPPWSNQLLQNIIIV